jgi:cytochrome c oxidase subunit 3
MTALTTPPGADHGVATHDHHHGHAHHPFQAHHFESMQHQFDAGKFGMWLFLITEVLFFSGLFCAYAIFRANHPEIFRVGHAFLDKELGALNTVVLLFSSLTMAWGVRCAQLGQKNGLVLCLSLTIACAGIFMVIKYFEYSAKISHGALLAGSVCLHLAQRQVRREHQLAFRGWLAGACVCGGAFVALQSYGLWQLVTWHLQSANSSRLWVFLFFLVGLHAAHVLAGVLVLGVVTVRAFHGRFDHEFHPGVTLCGRYWHFLDAVWLVMLLVFLITLG